MTFTAVKMSVDRLGKNYESYLEEQNLEDFYFSMGEVKVEALSGRTLWTLCENLDLEYECGLAISKGDEISYNHLNILINNAIKESPETYEQLIDQYIITFAKDYHFEYEKQYVTTVVDGEKTYKFVSLTNKIDIPYLVDGKLPINENEVAIFPEFAQNNNLTIGDALTIGDQTYLITGFFYKVDFLFPILSLNSISFDPENQTLVLANKQTMDALDQNLYLKYIVKGDLAQIFPNFGYETLQSGDYSILGREMSMISILLPSNINFRVISLRLELDNAMAFLNIFLPMFLAITLVLTILFLYRHIQKSRKTLFILHAIGYTERELATSMMILPLFIASMSFIGYTLGLVLSSVMFKSYSARYLFPKAPFSISLTSFTDGALLPFIIILFISYLFTIKTISNSLQNKHQKHHHQWKSLITQSGLFVILSFLLIFGFGGSDMFEDFTSFTKKGNHYVEMINLRYMTKSTLQSDYETYTRISTNVVAVNSQDLPDAQSSTLYGIDPSSSLKRLINDDIQSNELIQDGFVVSQYLKDSLNLQIGDELTIQVGTSTMNYPIVGFSNELLENNLFLAKELVNAQFDLTPDYYNGIYTTDTNYQSPDIVSRINYTQSIDDFSQILNVSSLLIGYLVLLSIFISAIALYLVLLNFLRSHQTDIALLRVIGYYDLEIHKQYYLPVALSALISFLISIPITYKALNLFLTSIMKEIGFRLIVLPKTSDILLALSTLSVMFLITFFVFQKYYEQASIASVLKRDDTR
jgi:putative ABC transport system permease protein